MTFECLNDLKYKIQERLKEDGLQIELNDIKFPLVSGADKILGELETTVKLTWTKVNQVLLDGIIDIKVTLPDCEELKPYGYGLASKLYSRHLDYKDVINEYYTIFYDIGSESDDSDLEWEDVFGYVDCDSD